MIAKDIPMLLDSGAIMPQGIQIVFSTPDATLNFDGNAIPLTTANAVLPKYQTGYDITTQLQILREKIVENTDPLPARKYQKLFTLRNGYDVYASVEKSFVSQTNDGIRLYIDDNGIYKNFGWNNYGALYFDGSNYPIHASLAFYEADEAYSSGYTTMGCMLFMEQNPYAYYKYVAAFRYFTTSSEAYPYLFGSLPASDDPYSTNEDQTPSGGFGDFDYSSDEDIPGALPSLSAAQVGFVSLWNPSEQEMKDLADYLWTGTFDLTNFKKLFTDPMECVLSVGIVPVTPTTGTSTEIIFGGSSHSGVNAKPITDQFVTVDMGSVDIKGQSASAMDYSPYCKASIFLPYCGTYALDVDDIMDANVALEYHIDIYTGACVAYVTITRTNSDGNTLHSTLYQFTGNVLATIPITGNDHSSFLQSLLFMGASVAATVATAGGAAPAIEGAAAAGDSVKLGALAGVSAGSAINTVMSMKPNVLRSGNLSSTAGLLGKQRPSITLTWSNLCRPDDEYKLVGMPNYKSGQLSEFEGFTVVSAVHMDNILCTETELHMIEQALYKGVIV